MSIKTEATKPLKPLRNTKPTQAVLAVFKSKRKVYGYEMMDLTGLRAGTVYPILRRLEDRGYLTSEWEIPGKAHSRPPRRYYRKTAKKL